ncbi:exodeoxyribonuclease VII large subunit [Enterococcus alcedinis]|uniref:Exodeoxyribonuclease 7 large subunit n=1 Tax=Enterococcus alcedinis TaxID=1274384 RepID=A0A917JHB6_9ENTE|nr:exodeoxyribonuclease VII large subunit [Enterococcus alcedinis]MBP2102291.1 exodeoxyribonuclease VII large subunit [Enterococcus alcedinis]GGI65850.1 exodeoxyribonuclease 7 large subunit [Enterococcus alcedinis]
MAQDYLTVSALTMYLKRKFEVDPHLQQVFLTGEISNFRMRPGHQYFNLKDEKSKISAVMFKGAFAKLNFKPEEGMKVLVVGRVSLFEGSGSYQIYIDRMEPDGVGALYQAYEQLKQKLHAEGLFHAPKKSLPKYPKKIAVLTSPSGAVIRDIITTIKRRYPIADIVLYPTVVQGKNSAPDIVRNIQRVEKAGDFDTMIIGRGGGSIEDLWPFNEEIVARSIFEARTPIISSVGHETDVTIADFVADMRAATPTAAAELAVPVLTEELMRIEEKQARLKQTIVNQIERKKQQHQRIIRSYLFQQPERLYESQALKVDQLKQRLTQQMQNDIYEKSKQSQLLSHRLAQVAPVYRVQQETVQLAYLTESLKRQMVALFDGKSQQFSQQVQALNLLSPLNIMGRGYNYTIDENGQFISSVKQLQVGEQVTVNYHDGQAKMKVIEVGEKQNDETDI